MVSLEKGKNVAFLVFEDIIKLISFKNERVFKSKVMKECKDAMLDDTFIGFKLSTTPENAEKINNKVYELKEEELNRNGLKRR